MKRDKYYDVFNQMLDDYTLMFTPLYSLMQYADEHSLTLPDWITESFQNYFDTEYVMQHAGERLISNFILKMYETFRRLQPNETEENIIKQLMENLGGQIYTKYLQNWDKLQQAMFADYDPIQNYDSTEEITRSGDDKTSVNTDTKQTSKVSAFNSATMQDNAEFDNSGLATNNYSKIDYNSKVKTTKKGNIGVTTSQQMIESEIQLRQQNFIDIIMIDIDKIWVSNLYFYKN